MKIASSRAALNRASSSRADRAADHRPAPVERDRLAGLLQAHAGHAVAAHRLAEQRHAERRVGLAPDRVGVEEQRHLRADRHFGADIEEDRRAAEQRPARGERLADQRADALAGAALPGAAAATVRRLNQKNASSSTISPQIQK